MATLKTLKDDIKAELDRPDIADIASSHIALAIRHYEREPMFFNEAQAITTAVAGTEFYAFPSDFVVPISLALTNQGNYFPLRQMTHTEHEPLSTDLTTVRGMPYAYSVIANQIRVYPIPDSASYTLTLTYIKRLSALSSPGASNSWTLDAEELIKSRAMKTLSLGVLKQPDWAAGFASMEQDALTRLKSETLQRTTSGRSSRWGF